MKRVHQFHDRIYYKHFSYACYLPNYPVIKASSLTTKNRVVFDASARTSNVTSVNYVLESGPTVQEDIFSILTRFWKHQYVVTTDIEKMFWQIMVAEKDCHFQQILWWAHPQEALQTYALATVMYGTTPSSFMATQCLVLLGKEAKERSAKILKVILPGWSDDWSRHWGCMHKITWGYSQHSELSEITTTKMVFQFTINYRKDRQKARRCPFYTRYWRRRNNKIFRFKF